MTHNNLWSFIKIETNCNKNYSKLLFTEKSKLFELFIIIEDKGKLIVDCLYWEKNM